MSLIKKKVMEMNTKIKNWKNRMTIILGFFSYFKNNFLLT